MAIQDKQLNAFNKEKRDLQAQLEKSPNSEDLKRKLKNVTEKIRYRTNKIISGEVTINEPVKGVKPFPKKGASIKAIVASEVALGLKSKDIAAKHGFKYDTVCWYKSQLKA